MRVTALFVCAAAGSLLLPALVASPALADDDPVLVTGTVTSPSGSPDAGATVLLVAEPSTATLEAMSIGDVVSTPVVAATTTSGSGDYSFNDPSTVPASSTDDGVVNYQVMTDGQGGGAYAFSDEAPSDATAAHFSRADHGLWAPASAAHIANVHEHAQKRTAKVVPLDDEEPDKGGNCATEYVKDYGNQSTTVARA